MGAERGWRLVECAVMRRSVSLTGMSLWLSCSYSLSFMPLAKLSFCRAVASESAGVLLLPGAGDGLD